MEKVTKVLIGSIAVFFISASAVVLSIGTEVRSAARMDAVVSTYQSGYDVGYKRGYEDAISLIILLQEKKTGPMAPNVIPFSDSFNFPLPRS